MAICHIYSFGNLFLGKSWGLVLLRWRGDGCIGVYPRIVSYFAISGNNKGWLYWVMSKWCFEIGISEYGALKCMKVGIIGGTGGIGKGMALRLSQNHEVVIGSRKQEKASVSCDDCCKFLKELGLPFNLMPSTNQGVVDNSDIVVFSVPPETLEVTID